MIAGRLSIMVAPLYIAVVATAAAITGRDIGAPSATIIDIEAATPTTAPTPAATATPLVNVLLNFFQLQAPPYSISAGVMPARFADMIPAETEYGGAGFWSRAKKWVKKHKKAICTAVVIACAATGIGAGTASAGSAALLSTAIAGGIPITGYCLTSIYMMSAISTASTAIGLAAGFIGDF